MSLKNLVGFIHELPALHKGLFIHSQGRFLFLFSPFFFFFNALAIK